MLVALTGTPGTGKTSVARSLRELGFRVIDLNRIAKARFAIGYDRARETTEIDIDGLRKYVSKMRIEKGTRAKEGECDKKKVVFIEGHLSHFMDVDMIIVLRAKPHIVEERLLARGYSQKKARENAEAEAIDAITIESSETGNKNAFEIDTSEANVHKVVINILEIVCGNAKERRKHRLGTVSWTDEVLGWY